MIKIAICDEDLGNRKTISDLTLKSLFDTIEVAFRFYENGMQIIDEVLASSFDADLLITDVVLLGIDGIRTVGFLRKFGLQTEVIFVSEAIEYSMEGYRLHAFAFIRKPISVVEFESVMRRYAKEKIQQSRDYLQVAIRGSFQKINLKKVMYFESAGRKIRAVGKEENTEFYQKMDHLEVQLEKNGFLRIHQSYIVNMLYVSFANASVIMLAGGIQLPVSKRYVNRTREAFRLT